MKKMIVSSLAIILILTLTAASCKKTSTEPAGAPPTVPTVTFSMPGQQDVCSQQASACVAFANSMTAYFASFSQMQPAVSGNVYTWEITNDSLTITFSATRQGDGSYVWELKLNGTEDGVTYTNKVILGGSTSADGKNGSFTVYDDSSPEIDATFTWSTSASNVLTGTLVENDSGGNPAYQYELVSNPNGSGEVTVSYWSGTAWVQDFHATWASAGAQATCG